MSTLTELGDFLEQQVAAFTQGQNLFLGSRPDEPDEVLVVATYPGGEPEYVQNSPSPNQEKPQIQIIARGGPGDYAGPDLLAARAYKVLATVKNATLSGTKYRKIWPTSPGVIGRDSNDRILIGFNATVEKEVSLVP